MRLDEFLRALGRRWYIPVVLIALAVAGAWAYSFMSGSKTAQATVVVPLKYFVEFDNIVNGRALAVRVADSLDDGTPPEDVEESIGGDVEPNERLTPLYAITGSAEGEDRAVLITNVALEEALELFNEGQDAEFAYVEASFQEQLESAEAETLASRDELDRFLADNNAYALETRLAEQSKLVTSLGSFSDLAGSIDGTASEVTESPQVAEARDKLDRLIALQPEYDRLHVALVSAQAAVQRLEAQANSLDVAGPGFDSARASVDTQLQEAQAELEATYKEAVRFNERNGLTNLAADIRIQQQEVNDLLLNEVDASSAAGLLANARAELERLQSLQPEFNRLARGLSNSEARLEVYQQQRLYVLQQTLPVDEELEVAETATIVPNTWWTIIRYAAAVLLAIFLSVTLVYTLAFFERTPPSVDELEREFARPVIGHVPRQARGGTS